MYQESRGCTEVTWRSRVRKNVNQQAHSVRGVRSTDLQIARANLYVLRGDNAPVRLSPLLCYTTCFVFV